MVITGIEDFGKKNCIHLSLSTLRFVSTNGQDHSLTQDFHISKHVLIAPQKPVGQL